MASTRKLPSGSWRSRIHIGQDENGKPKYKSFTAPTKREAEAKAYKYLEEHPTQRQMLYGNATVGNILDAHIEAKNGVISPTTLISYDRIRRLYFLDLQDKRPADLLSKDIQASVSALSQTVSPKTVRNAYGLLRAALAPYCSSDLFSGVKLPQKQKVTIRIPTDDEVKKILKYFKGTRYELPFSLAAFCGLRREEICALTFADFDFKKKKVQINKALVKNMDGGTEVKATKTTESTRIIPCPDRVLSLVSKDGKGKGTTNRIYEGNLDGLYNALQRALDDLKIEHIRLHDFRHYYCSVLIAENIPETYIMSMMGHSSQRMIRTVYGHIMPAAEQQAADKINSRFEKI